MEKTGRRGHTDISLRILVYIANRMEKAQEEPKAITLNFFSNVVTNLNKPLPNLSNEENQERVIRRERIKNITYEEILQTDTVYGTPEFAANRLLELKEIFGLSQIIAELTFGGLTPRAMVETSIHLFAEKAAPSIR